MFLAIKVNRYTRYIDANRIKIMTDFAYARSTYLYQIDLTIVHYIGFLITVNVM